MPYTNTSFRAQALRRRLQHANGFRWLNAVRRMINAIALEVELLLFERGQTCMDEEFTLSLLLTEM